jgi:hypothetical protein
MMGWLTVIVNVLGPLQQCICGLTVISNHNRDIPELIAVKEYYQFHTNLMEECIIGP